MAPRKVRAWNEQHTLSEWTRHRRAARDLTPEALRSRLKRMPPEDAIETPLRFPRTLIAWGQRRTIEGWLSHWRCAHGLTRQTLMGRIKAGWGEARAISAPHYSRAPREAVRLAERARRG